MTLADGRVRGRTFQGNGKWRYWEHGNGSRELEKILCPRSCVKKRFLVGFREVTDSRLS